ncbi:hypothetical protein [Desulfosporosinus fructosivorans]
MRSKRSKRDASTTCRSEAPTPVVAAAAPMTVKAFLYNQRRADVLAIFGDPEGDPEGNPDHQALIDYFAGEAPRAPIPKVESPIAVIQKRWEAVTCDELQALYDQGKPSHEIGKIYGVSKVKVVQAAKAHGIDRSTQRTQLRRTP